MKKTQVVTLLKHYNKNRDIDSLGRGLYMLLETPIDQRLLPDIRYHKESVIC